MSETRLGSSILGSVAGDNATVVADLKRAIERPWHSDDESLSDRPLPDDTRASSGDENPLSASWTDKGIARAAFGGTNAGGMIESYGSGYALG